MVRITRREFCKVVGVGSVLASMPMAADAINKSSPKRVVVLDTETTGLDWRQGNRIIEIGCVELIENERSGRTFHSYLNPDHPIFAGAQAVHGLTEEFLEDKPRFAEIFQSLITFVAGSTLVIHNAPFDTGFLDYELGLIGHGSFGTMGIEVIDTLRLAREKWPGESCSLDGLCERLAIDASHRDMHGALLDASLLADVYVAMIRGAEGNLS